MAATAELDSFLMSCRVIGRGAETAFLAAVLERLATDGFHRVRASWAAAAASAPSRSPRWPP